MNHSSKKIVLGSWLARMRSISSCVMPSGTKLGSAGMAPSSQSQARRLIRSGTTPGRSRQPSRQNASTSASVMVGWQSNVHDSRSNDDSRSQDPSRVEDSAPLTVQAPARARMPGARSPIDALRPWSSCGRAGVITAGVGTGVSYW